MSRLDSLIRLNRWQLDEKRRRAAELGVMADQTRQRIGSLDRELEAEARIVEARADLSEGAAWHAYARSIGDRRRKLEVTLATIEAQIEEINEEIAADFRELKKVELVSEARLRRAREAADRREQFALDEMGLSSFRRSSAS